MSLLALLQEWDAAAARAKAAEEARRAALSPFKRWLEDFQAEAAGVLFWLVLGSIPLTILALAAYGAWTLLTHLRIF